MEKVNAWTIQETLKKMQYVSVPWIQIEYHLNYQQAKEFLGHLFSKGWVESTPEGNRYPVISENLKLRTITADEVDTLFDEINYDCTAALSCIQKQNGANLEQIIRAVRDDEDAKEAISILIKNDLIYLVGDIYYSCISQKAIKVLSNVVKAKRHYDLRSREDGDVSKNDEIKALFNELFE